VLSPGPLYESDDQSALKRSVEVVSRYLRLFADALPDHWARGNAEGGYLCTNNGLTALLSVLAALVEHLGSHGILNPWQASPDELIDGVEPFTAPLIEHFASATPDAIRSYRRQVGNSGQRRVAFAMIEVINAAKPSFDPPGLEEFKKSKDATGTVEARQIMPELQLKIHAATVTLLKSKFGDDEKGWWRQGVPEKVRTEVAARREANPDPGGYEQFFELLDYRSIAARNWDLCKPFFKFGEGNSMEKQLDWFSKLVAIRNRIAHPERGPVSDEELFFLESLLAQFESSSSLLPTVG
jgi:hypothetical protein